MGRPRETAPVTHLIRNQTERRRETSARGRIRRCKEAGKILRRKQTEKQGNEKELTKSNSKAKTSLKTSLRSYLKRFCL